MTYRWIFGVSLIALLLSFSLAISYFSKGAEDWKIWVQQSFLWIGLLGVFAGHVVKALEERIAFLEKQQSKGEFV